MKNFSERVLFYMFYNLTLDMQQKEAAKELARRGWKYNKVNMRWYKQASKGAPANVAIVFDPISWSEQQQPAQKIT